MKIVVPDYYDKFICVADECNHNCCIGWEIDIDNDTYYLYENIIGNIGDKLRKHIAEEDEYRYFKLNEAERCPFLNENNLCEIIITKGEGYLCQICRDHPRFKNYYTDRIEIGVGLCCESAAFLILNRTNKTLLLTEGEGNDTDEEKVFFNIREKIFKIIQDRDLTISKRIEQICSFFDLEMDIDKNELINLLSSLERFDEGWNDLLTMYEKTDFDYRFLLSEDKWQIVYEQLLVYFMYRHLTESLYDNCFIERIKFSILSCEIIFNLFVSKNKLNIEEFIEIARMYSCEIEYSTENINVIIEFLK